MLKIYRTSIQLIASIKINKKFKGENSYGKQQETGRIDYFYGRRFCTMVHGRSEKSGFD